MELRKILECQDLELCFPVMKELRTELSFENFLKIFEFAERADGYSLVGAFEKDRCMALMGYRVLYDFIHGKHLYIDDLVTTEACRSKGVGSALLNFAEDEAARLGCDNLRLCTGITNEGAKRFYEREGWQNRAVVYKKKLSR